MTYCFIHFFLLWNSIYILLSLILNLFYNSSHFLFPSLSFSPFPFFIIIYIFKSHLNFPAIFVFQNFPLLSFTPSFLFTSFFNFPIIKKKTKQNPNPPEVYTLWPCMTLTPGVIPDSDTKWKKSKKRFAIWITKSDQVQMSVVRVSGWDLRFKWRTAGESRKGKGGRRAISQEVNVRSIYDCAKGTNWSKKKVAACEKRKMNRNKDGDRVEVSRSLDRDRAIDEPTRWNGTLAKTAKTIQNYWQLSMIFKGQPVTLKGTAKMTWLNTFRHVLIFFFFGTSVLPLVG